MVCITPKTTHPMFLIQATIRVWFTTRGHHLITFTWDIGLTRDMDIFEVIRLDWVTHRGITQIISMVIIHHGTFHTTTVLIGGPTGGIVRVLLATGITIATVTR